jgi:hypothetical protein
MRSAAILAVTIVAVSCAHPERPHVEDLRAPAEQYLSAVYGCRSELVDSVVSDSIVASYPIFETVFGTSALRGREAVRRYAEGFCGRWADPELTIHEAVQDGRRVALVWEFRAVPTFGDSLNDSISAAPQSWGGITFLRFDEAGKVVLEVGEESTPGPMARISR